MIEYAKKLRELNKFDIEFEGKIEDIIENPREWAKLSAEGGMLDNIPRYLEAKKLGKEFASDIKNNK